MLFPTFTFLIFFVIVFVLNWMTRQKPFLWKMVILAASLVFYGWWNWRFVFLLGTSITINWFCAKKISHESAKLENFLARRWMQTAVIANLSLLGVYKYYDFFVLEISNRLNQVGFDIGLPLLDLTLPIGISFFTFQAISYVIDVGREDIEPLPLLDFAVYLSFFPQLVAGPIVRASEMAPQMSTRSDPRYLQSATAYRLILGGLFKKVVISSYLADVIVQDVFANPSSYSSTDIMVGVYAYAIQIYADFSGYTDIAIGVALLLGFRFPQNFDSPYRAKSLQDFWHRWHITLSAWLRDYLYIPLGGSRGTRRRLYANLMLTMILGGLWHGNKGTFLVWGLIHGLALVVERIVSERINESQIRNPFSPRIWSLIRWMTTFHVVCLAWIFFRAPSVGDALTMLGGLFSFRFGTDLVTSTLLLVILGAIGMQFVSKEVREVFQAKTNEVSAPTQALLFALGLVFIDWLGPDGVAPFIYFQF